jgi:hypothetical protein
MTPPGLRAVAVALMLCCGGPAGAALGQERARVDLYDLAGNRTGHAVVDPRTGRVDTYDRLSNRTGYGTIDRSGTLQLFDMKGNRVGSGRMSPTPTPRSGR